MAKATDRPPGLTDEQWEKQIELAEFARNCPKVVPKYGYTYPHTRPGVYGSHEKRPDVVADSRLKVEAGKVPVVEAVFKGVVTSVEPADGAVAIGAEVELTKEPVFRLECPPGQDFGKLELPLLKVGDDWQDSKGTKVAAGMAKIIEKQLSLKAKGWKLVVDA